MIHTFGVRYRQLQVITPHEIAHILRPCKNYMVLHVQATSSEALATLSNSKEVPLITTA